MESDVTKGLAGTRVLITGGAGFIGTRIVERIADQADVVIYDNMARDSLSSSDVRNHPNVTTIVGDVLDVPTLREAMSEAQVVVHCAGIAGIDTVGRSPVRTMSVNMIGSANVLQLASELKTMPRVICFSTSEVFGQHAFQSAETDRTVIGAVGEARWTYAVSKLAEEHLAIAYHRERHLPATVLRPFNIYGPGQMGEGAIRNFVLRALRDEPIDIYGDGSQIRAWCYVDDMVDAVMLAAEVPGAAGESFNIGNRRSVETVWGLARAIVRVLSAKSEIRFIPRDAPDVELRIPSIEKARDVLGFEAKIDLEEGILRTAEYFRRHLPD
jgi:UDP-glucose 4-epimerase